MPRLAGAANSLDAQPKEMSSKGPIAGTKNAIQQSARLSAGERKDGTAARYASPTVAAMAAPSLAIALVYCPYQIDGLGVPTDK
jgi:gentisate 1,2-dioxygenase